MSVKVYKRISSPPCRAVMMACDILGVNAEFLDVNILEKEHYKPEYLKKNPLHTAPLLEDGKLYIQDSHAILQYLADAYGKSDSMYPKDLKRRAQVNQKLFFDACYLFPRLRNITYPAVLEGERKITKRKMDDVIEAYDFIEVFLSQTKFLAGDQMTIADLSAIPTVTSLLILIPLDVTKYPKTHAWVEEMLGKPFCKKYNEPGLTMLAEILKRFIDDLPSIHARGATRIVTEKIVGSEPDFWVEIASG